MGNKASEEMMIVDDSELVQPVKSVAQASNQDSMLEQLDKFIHHHENFARNAKQDQLTIQFLEQMTAHVKAGGIDTQTLPALKSSRGLAELVRTLLQNNSMADVERRGMLYRAFLDMLATLASNENTVGFFEQSLTASANLQVATRSGFTTLSLLAALSRRSSLFLQLHPLKSRPQYHAAHPNTCLQLKSVHLANVIIAVEHYVQLRVKGHEQEEDGDAVHHKRSFEGNAKQPAPTVSTVAPSPSAAELAVQKVMVQLDELYKVKKSSWVSSMLGFHPGGLGTGFGGAAGSASSLSHVPGVAKATQAETKHDKAVQECLEKLNDLLGGNGIIKSVLGVLRERPGFRQMCIHLLHNDSLLDICRRIPLYRSVLQLLRTMAQNPFTAPYLVEPLLVDDKGKRKAATCISMLAALAHQSRVYLQLQPQAPPAPAQPEDSEPSSAPSVPPVEGVTTRSGAKSGTEAVKSPGATAPAVDESVIIVTAIIDTELAVNAALHGQGTDANDAAMAADSSCSSQSSVQPGCSSGASGEGDGTAISASGASSSLIGTIARHMFHNSVNAGSSSSAAPPLSGKKADSTDSTSGITNRSRPLSQAEVEDAYVNAMTPHRFEAIDLCARIDRHTVKHTYYSPAGATPSQAATHSYQTSRAAQNTGVSSNPKQRMTRIAKEMATLSTSLPVEYGSSIFVRVDESRMDLIKALIIGPLGTPYANGCFEFDILLPPDYPHRPPSVMLVTTGGGTVRFNPNLYNSGYVCLSLLGTWSGPGWDAQHSTLLQVLVSIQSLIMVPDPYYNEPGYQYMRSDPASTAYNKNIRYQCLRFAVHGQLQQASSSVFCDVISAHFKHKRAAVLEQMEAWRSDLAGGDAIIASIKAELDKL